jgi:hypothetical protein
MIDMLLVPEKTVVAAKGDGPAVEIRGASQRTFLAILTIAEIVEQEALDVSIYGSADGAAWGAKPIASFPQRFYRGETPLLIDLKGAAEVQFLRAHWEVNRWGRGPEAPMFQFTVRLKEVPPEVLKMATAEEKTRV